MSDHVCAKCKVEDKPNECQCCKSTIKRVTKVNRLTFKPTLRNEQNILLCLKCVKDSDAVFELRDYFNKELKWNNEDNLVKTVLTDHREKCFGLETKKNLLSKQIEVAKAKLKNLPAEIEHMQSKLKNM
jgi:hypothetical protein